MIEFLRSKVSDEKPSIVQIVTILISILALLGGAVGFLINRSSVTPQLSPDGTVVTSPKKPAPAYKIAEQFKERGEYEKALESYQNALIQQTQQDGAGSVAVGRVHNAIGSLLLKMEKYDEAKDAFIIALAIFEEEKDKPMQVDALINLSYMYTYKGEYDAALKECTRGLEIAELFRGKKRFYIAYFYNARGGVYICKGEYDTALECRSKASEIFKKVLGKNHPTTAWSYNNVGWVYSIKGEYDTALQWYNKALEIREKVLGEDHRDTATSYNDIGVVYYNKSEYDTALEWYNKALAIRENILGKDHPDTAASYYNIGIIYRKKGEYDTALKWFNKALAIRKKVYGEDHSYTATLYNHLGLVYCDKGEYDTALERLNKALEISEKVYGEDDSYTISVREVIEAVQSQKQLLSE